MEKGARIGEGRTAEVYAWGGDRILKLYQDWMPAGAVGREYAVTRAAQAAGVPVPAAEEPVEVDGRFGIVFERIQGPSLLKEMERRPWAMPAIIRRMAELHARILTCSVPSETPSQRTQMEANINAARDLSEAKKALVMDHLSQIPEGDRLCHGDFHPDTFLVGEQGPVVIDWLTAGRGNPLGDVSRTSMLFHTGGLPPYIPGTARDRRLAKLDVWDIPEALSAASSRRASADRCLGPADARLREVDAYPREKATLLARLEKLISRQTSSS